MLWRITPSLPPPGNQWIQSSSLGNWTNPVTHPRSQLLAHGGIKPLASLNSPNLGPTSQSHRPLQGTSWSQRKERRKKKTVVRKKPLAWTWPSSLPPCLHTHARRAGVHKWQERLSGLGDKTLNLGLLLCHLYPKWQQHWQWQKQSKHHCTEAVVSVKPPIGNQFGQK